uniref:FTH domain-containing protein n=1 Tax=Caenorhabditis tropicalis TaxID=1561998 RepID=A0A1I7UI07_9PELO
MDERRPSTNQIYFRNNYHNSRNTVNLLIVYKSTGPESDKSWERSYNGEDNLKKAFDGMKTLLINPRLRLEVFLWDNELDAELDEKLMEILKSLNHKMEVVYLDATLNADLLIDLLKAIKPETLEEIELRGKFEPIHIDRLAQLDQWKKPEGAYFWDDIPNFSSCLHHFQHFKNAAVEVESLSMDDILFIKQLFTQNDKLESFKIDVEDKPSESEIVERLGHSELRVNEKEEYFFRLYEIPGSNDQLEVTIMEIGIHFIRKPLNEEDC